MTDAYPAISAFDAGELSPQMEGRVDIDKYPLGCHVLSNFIALVQGPAMRRAGTRFVAEVKNSSTRTWLRKFEFSSTQAFQIEFGDRYCRFFTLQGELLPGTVAPWSASANYVLGNLASLAGVTYYCTAQNTNQAPPNAAFWSAMGAVYEIPSPYAGADLTNDQNAFAFTIEQSGDVLYIAGGATGYPPYTLTRFSDTNWQFALYQPQDGPFLDLNTTSTTLQSSGSTGTVTITASSATGINNNAGFLASDVGRLLRLEVQSFLVAPWESGKTYALAAQTRSFGKTYKSLNSAVSGTQPPEHLFGSQFDGQTGVNWAYQDSGYGVAQITAVTDPTHVVASVIVNDNSGLAQLPTDVVTGNTKRWRLGAWSASTEYPRACAFFSDRLIWAGKIRLWGSVPGLYTSHTPDFFGQVTTDSAFAVLIAAQDVNNIVWMLSAAVLLIGTEGGEFGLGPITTTNPLGPDNVHIIRQSKNRCRTIRPELIGISVLYVQRAARKLLSMDYNFYLDRYDSTNQSRMAYHITQSGLCDMAYQAEPYQVLWGVRNDGLLLGYTFDRQDNVTGWHRHPIGGNGVVESVSVTPAPDGLRDEVWLIVKRTINGTTRRYVEFIEKQYESGDAQSSCFYLDAGATYSGSPATVISGLNYLEGQTVSIFRDGGTHPDKTVQQGSITLEIAGSIVQVGLRCSAKLVTMRPEFPANGTAQGKTKRIVQGTVRVVDSLGGKVGMENGQLDALQLNDPTVPMDSPPQIFSGDIPLSWPGEWETDGKIQIQNDDPTPMTVVGIFPAITVQSPM